MLKIQRTMHKGIFFMILLWCCTAMQAITITGYVRDAQDAAMPFVTISLLSADSTLISGTITTDDGAFAIEAPTEAAIVQASYVGYRTGSKSLTSVLSVGDGRVMDFCLVEETTTLSEVVVSGNQKLVERRADKLVMNVASSPFAIGNNGKDILRKAPGVNIDRKGNVTVNGKAIEVYVDGKPSYLSGSQLKTMLEATDGSTIDRIEIIMQPSAKYDAAGQGGIINIRTKRNRTRGLNGNLSFSYGGMFWRDIRQMMQDEHLSFGLNYRGEHTYTALSLGQQAADQTETSHSESASPLSLRRTYSETRNLRHYATVKLSHDWYIDSLNTLGATVHVPLSIVRRTGSPDQNYSELWQDSVLIEKAWERTHHRDRSLQHTANINYTHIFSHEREQQLNLLVDYSLHNGFSRLNSLNRLPSDSLCIRQQNRRLTNIYSARMDFESLFWRDGKIECGMKWLTTQNTYSNQTDSLPGSADEDAFSYTEHIAALYITAGKSFGEHWTTKLGLRGEYTVGNHRYFDLFPTVFVGYSPTEDWPMSVEYSRRIQRPAYEMLNPAVLYEDAHSVRVGNPNLKPSYTHNVLVSFGYSEYVSLEFNFSHTTDWMDYAIRFTESNDRIATATNYGTNTAHGIFLSLTEIPIVPKYLCLTSQMGANRETYRSYDGHLNMHHWTLDVYAELNAYLPHDWTVSLDGYFSTPGVWGAEKLSGWKEMNLAVKKDFPRHNLTLTMRVNDLMLSSRWSSTTLGLPEGYSNSFSGYDRAHSLTFGLSYKFGSSFSSRRTISSDLDSDRLQSTSSRRGRRE